MEFPCFLVALPQMQDDLFSQAVVLLSHQDEEGAFGLLLNRPILQPLNEEDDAKGGTPVVAEVRDALSDKVYELRENVFRGGPVEDNSIFVIHEDENLSDGGTRLSDQIFLSTNPSVLQNLLEMGEEGPRRNYYLGCSAWAKGQLESEIRAGSWVMLPFDEKVIFEEADLSSDEPWATRMWRKVLLSGGLDPLTLMPQGRGDSGYN
jgi:putative transcriptional regulator